MEMNEFQHPNSVWACKSNNCSWKTRLWITYWESIKKEKGSKWTMNHKGGSVQLQLIKIK